ncbi:MAG TPA: GNAT family N-acetyltransferase [Acidimicrobiales bacterium]|nr:GNAT family N-acetyltransferase [Acidimicrobiales bacterium]
MTLRVRPMERGDVAAAARLVAAGTLATGAENVDREDVYWSAVLETRARRGEVLVAEAAGEVVGVTQVLIFQHFQHTGGWCAELESVHVRDDFRSRGVGSALLAAAESVARERGCYRMQLTSRNVRTDAHRFYVANGYDQNSQGFKKLLVE